MERLMGTATRNLSLRPPKNRERWRKTSTNKCVGFFLVMILAFVWVDIFINHHMVQLLDLNVSSYATTESDSVTFQSMTTTSTRGTNIDTIPLSLSLSSLEKKYSLYHFRPAEPRHDVSGTDPKCGSFPDFQQYFEQSQMFRSSRNEDRTIYELFFHNDQSNYTYVELGAFNGKRESNTRFFDLCLHWSGLLIEANPLKYPKLLENRPHAHCLNYAPSCMGPMEIAFHSVAFTNAAQADVANFYDNTSLVDVPCDRLTPALLDIMGGQVTFFSLDVEGAENQVLRTVDFATIHVDIWMMENVNRFCQREQLCESRDESRALLQRAGYVGYVHVVMGSDVFVFPGSQYDKIITSRFNSSLHRIETIRLG